MKQRRLRCITQMPTFGLFMLLLISLVASADWVMDGNGGVYWEANNVRISAWPATSNSPVGQHEQFVNFTYNRISPATVNLSFVFPSDVSEGSAMLWGDKDVPISIPTYGRLNGEYTTAATSSTTTTEACEIGDSQNAIKRLITINATDSKVVCFNTYANNSGIYTFYYTYDGITGYTQGVQSIKTWKDISHLFSSKTIGNKKVFTINNVYFQEGTKYAVKFNYRTSAKSGKFDIYAHEGSPQQVVAGTANVYVVLDPWYNSSQYTYRIPINCSNVGYGTPIAINGSGGFYIGGEKQLVWTFCPTPQNLTLYYGNISNYVVVRNDTELHPFDVDIGNGTSYNISGVYSYANITRVYHGNDLSETINGYNFTVRSGTIEAELNSTKCTFGKCLVFKQAGSWANASIAGLPTGQQNSSVQMWLWRSDDWTNNNAPFSSGNNHSTFYQQRNIIYDTNKIGINLYSGQISAALPGTTKTQFMMTGIFSPNNTRGLAYVNLTNGSGTTTSMNTANLCFQIGDICSKTEIGTGYRYVKGTAPASIDELRYYNNTISDKFINDTFYNSNATLGYGTLGEAEVLTEAIIFSFISQTPANLTSLNAIGTPLNISYNITSSTLNTSTPILFYKTNTTASDITYFVNGTAYSGWFNRSYSTNNSGIYNFTLYDNQIYPATYLINEATMEATTHTAYSLSGSNLLKIEFLNVSFNNSYNIFEIMANTTGTRPLELFYCNSTYTTGNPASSSSCTNFYSIIPTNTFNHTHSAYSSHNVAPLPFANGKINGVQGTSQSYILMQTALPTTWNIWYVPNTSRSTTTATSGNNGVSYTAQTWTPDAHIHTISIFNQTTLYYYASALNTTGTRFNDTTIKSDLIDAAILPPSEPTILSPTEAAYRNGTLMNITYLNATSPTGANITRYNISLFTANGTFVKAIVANNSPNTTYNWSVNVSTSAVYEIRISALDTNGLSSTSVSPYVYLYNYSATYNANGADLSPQTHVINFSNDGSVSTMAGNMTYNSDTNTATIDNQTSYISLSAIGNPSIVSVPTNFTADWLISVLSGYANYSLGFNYTQLISPSGLVDCTGNYTNVSINISIRDIATNASVNASYSASYTYGLATRTISGINDSYRWCIYPPDASFPINLTETYAASGYSPSVVYRSVVATNITQNFIVYLANSTTTKQTNLKVVATPAIPVSGAVIEVYEYTPPHTYVLYQSCTTNAAGVCVVYLIPNSQQYLYNITAAGNTTSFGTEVVVCDESASTCYRVFTLGNDNYIPYLTSGNIQGRCTNTTTTIDCNATDSGGRLTSFTLTISRLGNATALCTDSDAGSSASVSCAIPNIDAVLTFAFYGVDGDGNIYPLSSGTITSKKTFANRWGTDGWIAAGILFIGAAMGAAFSPWLGLLVGLFSIGLSAMLGLVPEGILILMAGGIFVIGVIGYKMRV